MSEHPLIGDKRYPALVTAAVAVIGLPFYLGLTHVSPIQLALYSGVASTAMAAGQYADSPTSERGSTELLLWEAGLWFTLICIGGGLAYLIALVF
jgi:hypothetical protein